MTNVCDVAVKSVYVNGVPRYNSAMDLYLITVEFIHLVHNCPQMCTATLQIQ